MDQQNLFKWRHYQAEIILLCVRWYLLDCLQRIHTPFPVRHLEIRTLRALVCSKGI